MLSLDTEINIDLPGFFRWWGDQLVACLPEKIKQIFDESHSILLVEPEGQKLTLKLIVSGQPHYLGQFDFNEIGKAQFQLLKNEKQAIANAQVWVRLPKHLAIVKQLNIPDAASSNLRQVLSYEMDRYTPFKSDQVYFDFIVTDKDKINKQLNIKLILTPLEHFNEIMQGIWDWGLQPGGVDCQNEPGIDEHLRHRYNLLPEPDRQKKDKKPLMVMLAAVLLILVFGAGVILTPLIMKINTIHELREEERKTEKQAHRINEVKRKIDTLYEESAAVISKKSDEPSFIEILESLSALMHDDTWLMHLKYNNNKLHIQGQSPSASALIGSLEKVDYFQNTHFVSPVTQDKRSGLERFQIATEVGPAGAQDD